MPCDFQELVPESGTCTCGRDRKWHDEQAGETINNECKGEIIFYEQETSGRKVSSLQYYNN